MSKIIEILDSDDEVAEPLEDSQEHTQPTEENVLTSISAVVDDGVEQMPSVSNKDAEVDSISIPSTTTVSSTVRASESPTKTRSRHRRKSTHQHMRASPEMQFETISLDDEDDELKAGPSVSSNNNQLAQPIAKAAKFFKTTPKILGTKPPTTEEIIDTDFENFLANDEIAATVRQIAEERIRINFLLASYGMPDISFSLYSNYERLKFQFEDRVKQRKMRSWNRAQDSKLKKRRTQEKT